MFGLIVFHNELGRGPDAVYLFDTLGDKLFEKLPSFIVEINPRLQIIVFSDPVNCLGVTGFLCELFWFWAEIQQHSRLGLL